MRDTTNLRYVCSKDPDFIVEYVSLMLPYKIEIKGAPVFVKGKWYIWFNLPDRILKEFPTGNID